MAEFVVNVTIETKAPLTERTLVNVAAIGGAAGGNEGGRLLETGLTVEAEDLLAAIAAGSAQILKIAPGKVVAAEGMTVREAERQLAAGDPMLGVTEIAAVLGVSKQRASVISRRRDFPKPAAELSQGKTWRRADVEKFVRTWARKAGRPTAKAAARASARL